MLYYSCVDVLGIAIDFSSLTFYCIFFPCLVCVLSCLITIKWWWWPLHSRSMNSAPAPLQFSHLSLLCCHSFNFWHTPFSAPLREHVDVLLDRVCVDLFHKIRCYEHCLHDILPHVLSHSYDMRHRAHSFVPPQFTSNLYKKSFINYCLFKDV